MKKNHIIISIIILIFFLGYSRSTNVLYSSPAMWKQNVINKIQGTWQARNTKLYIILTFSGNKFEYQNKSFERKKFKGYFSITARPDSKKKILKFHYKEEEKNNRAPSRGIYNGLSITIKDFIFIKTGKISSNIMLKF